MPLTEFQSKLAKLLATQRTPDSYLAGGAALHIQPNSKRFSNDLDYFHDSEQRVTEAFQKDEALLKEHQYEIEVVMHQPGFVRAVVKRESASTKVEWVHDSSWRFLPTIQSKEAGYILHPIDLALNKLLALIGRDEPRDYIDIHEVIENTLGLGALCWAAAGKDPGFTPAMILDLLRRRGRLQPYDLKRLHLTKALDLIELKKKWLNAIEDAENFIESRNPEEIGCLYYSQKLNKFIQPEINEKVICHYGRPGGVLPILNSNTDN